MGTCINKMKCSPSFVLLACVLGIFSRALALSSQKKNVIKGIGKHTNTKPNILESDVEVTIDSSKIVSNLSHFWTSTGFCPPAPHQSDWLYFLSDDEAQNLAHISSIPQAGIQQVRVHWLLDLVTLSPIDNGSTIMYDFTLLDIFLEMFYSNDLRPGFELMGNPSDYFTDFEDKQQLYIWKDMVTQLAKRYINKFGIEYVSQWNFETWNEPDHKDFDGLNITLQGFLNYYDACSEGLKAADEKLKFGGPGAACREESFSIICWALLEHCTKGTNYFTGETGVRIDYISFHHKGKGQSMYILDTELDTISKIHSLHPSLKTTPIFNDEGDPLVGWSKPEQWRADATYAAIVAKIICQHQNLLLSKSPDINYTLLSNDNSFLNYNPSYFDQRTLLARFQINNTEPTSVKFIRKPVMTVMGLLALLGESQIYAEVKEGGSLVSNTSFFGVLASLHTPTYKESADSWQLAALVYNSNDTSNVTTEPSQVKLSIDLSQAPPISELLYVAYSLDNENGNPYAGWVNMGKPVFPTQIQMEALRHMQEPKVTEPESLPTGQSSLQLNFNLSLPGVMLLHLCAKPTLAPNQVSGVRIQRVDVNEVLVLWSDNCINCRCLKTFEVEFSSDPNKSNYQRINDYNSIFTAFVFSPPTNETKVLGFYRVRAVNYWGHEGLYSLPVQYPAPS